jgi:hypothetical protein
MAMTGMKKLEKDRLKKALAGLGLQPAAAMDMER